MSISAADHNHVGKNDTEYPPRSGSAVSVLIPAKNEASQIEGCLESVSWAGEVIVVDSRSTDDTASIVHAHGAKLVQFEYVRGGLKKKNWALQNLTFKFPWVLIVDADERIPPQLAREIDSAVASSGPIVGYYINRRFYFVGRWIRHAGYYPSWNLRLLKQGAGLYEIIPDTVSAAGDNEVHEHILLSGPAGRLSNDMEHYAFPTISTFVEKHNRYSSWEASVGRACTKALKATGDLAGVTASLNARRARKRIGRCLPGGHWLRFVYHYIWKMGVLDGYPGYIFCHLLSEYEFLIRAKTAFPEEAAVRKPPSQTPEQPL